MEALLKITFVFATLLTSFQAPLLYFQLNHSSPQGRDSEPITHEAFLIDPRVDFYKLIFYIIKERMENITKLKYKYLMSKCGQIVIIKHV